MSAPCQTTPDVEGTEPTDPTPSSSSHVVDALCTKRSQSKLTTRDQGNEKRPLKRQKTAAEEVQSLDESEEGVVRDSEQAFQRVQDDPQVVEALDKLYDLLVYLNNSSRGLKFVPDGSYGNPTGKSCYILHQRLSLLKDDPSSQITLEKWTRSFSDLPEVTRQAQEARRREIEMRQKDIKSLDSQIMELSNQLARHPDTEQKVAHDISLLSQMKGEHLRKIKELEALKEIPVSTSVLRERGSFSFTFERTSSRATEVKMVPAQKRPKTLLILGGSEMEGGTSHDYFGVSTVDLRTKRCTHSTDVLMNSAREGFSTAVLDGKVYVIGGLIEVPEVTDTILNTMEVFDPQQMSFTTSPAIMQTGRFYSAAAVLSNCLYVLGGELDQQLRSVERYNASSERWEQVASMNQFRSGLAAAVLKDHLYALGGENGDCLKTVERYDAARNVWEPVADLTVARRGCAAVVVDGKLFVMGGENKPNNHSALSSVEYYDEEKNEWKLVAPMNHRRWDLAAVVRQGKILVIGGQDIPGSTIKTMEEYDPVQDKWTELQGPALRRQGMGAFLF